MTPDKPTLHELVREAKEERVPEVDWSKVEAKLFPRVEREASARAALGKYAGAKRPWMGVAVALAAAATVPLFFAPKPRAPLETVVAAREPGAGTLTSKDRGASVHVRHGALAHSEMAPSDIAPSQFEREIAAGDAIARGDDIDVHGGRATFGRGEPGGVSWSVDDGSQVEVRSTRGTLILALEKGAVEAQVTPVTSGEAFAIDVDGTRVAVHGTHLRVERQGARAIVDLGEGVVSIGKPPKGGATYGDLVTAPAHVEFDSVDPHGTLKVTHDVARLRAALALPPPAEDTHRMAFAYEPSAPRPVAAPAPAPAPIVPAPRTVAPATSVPAAAQSSAPAPAAPATVSSPVPPPPAPSHVAADPEHTIAEAVRACARQQVEHPDGVVITVSSRLELHVGDAGMVTSARFDPPLAPNVQACAATAIYGTRFSQPGAVSIPIDFTP